MMPRQSMSRVEYDMLMRCLFSAFDRAGFHGLYPEKDLRWGCGKTDNKYPSVKCYVGMDWPYDDSVTECSIGIALAPLVASCHEACGHAGQIMKQFQKTDTLSKVLAANYYACVGSNSYYFGDTSTRQYFLQPHEIAAEYAGLKCAYGFLSDIYGKEEASGMLCEYVNYKASICSSCLDSRDIKYRSIRDVFRDYNECFNKNVFVHRTYFASKDSPNYDAVMLWADMDLDEYEKLSDYVNSYGNGLKQDLLLARMCIIAGDGDLSCDLPVLHAMSGPLLKAFDPPEYSNMVRGMGLGLPLSLNRLADTGRNVRATKQEVRDVRAKRDEPSLDGP